MKVSMVLPSVRTGAILAVGTMPVQDEVTLPFGYFLGVDTGACHRHGDYLTPVYPRLVLHGRRSFPDVTL